MRSASFPAWKDSESATPLSSSCILCPSNVCSCWFAHSQHGINSGVTVLCICGGGIAGRNTRVLSLSSRNLGNVPCVRGHAWGPLRVLSRFTTSTLHGGCSECVHFFRAPPPPPISDPLLRCSVADLSSYLVRKIENIWNKLDPRLFHSKSHIFFSVCSQLLPSFPDISGRIKCNPFHLRFRAQASNVPLEHVLSITFLFSCVFYGFFYSALKTSCLPMRTSLQPCFSTTVTI